MNREIKFRAWDTKKSTMIDIENRDFAWLGENGLEDPRYEIMQYTNLKDKNGVLIYEGDIVQCEQMQGFKFPVKGVIHFGVEAREWYEPKGTLYDARVYLDTRSFDKNTGSEYCILHVNPEIIGNIYQNPELLTNVN